MVVIFWILRAEHNGLRDGLVYGALVGAGFNWFEAALYVAQGYAEYGVASGFRMALATNGTLVTTRVAAKIADDPL